MKKTLEESVTSSEGIKVTATGGHCLQCQPSKSGYKLDHNVFDENKQALTHVFVNEQGAQLSEPCQVERGSGA